MNKLAAAFRWIAVVALAASVFAGPIGAQPAAALMAVWRVAPGGASTGACGDTWANACDLGYALASAASAPGELWVQQGTYLPTTGTDQTVSFVLRTGIAVFGGFEGDENARSERDYGTYVTTLSGNIGDAGITSDNSYHVVSAPAGVDNTAALDGFTITAGDAGAFSEPNSNGAGIYLYQASPTLTNLVITNNAAWLNGGAIYNYQGSPTLSYLTITANRALRGAGMYSYEGTPDLEFVNFLANIAPASGTASSLGGGMYNYDSDADLEYVTFSSNSAAASASYGGYGGGMYNDLSNPTLIEVTFTNNSTPVFAVGDPSAGGGMYNYESSPMLTDVDFSGNGSTQGAGMMNVGGTQTLTSVTFTSNSATNGGGMYNNHSNATLTDVDFNSNLAGQSGGAMHLAADGGQLLLTMNGGTFDGNTATTAGGAIAASSTGGSQSNIDLTISNAYFLDNQAGASGGALYQVTAGPDDDGPGSTISLQTSVLAGNSAGQGGAVYSQTTGGDETENPTWSDPKSFLNFTSITASGNSAGASGGMLYLSANAGSIGEFSMNNSVLWGDNDSLGVNEIVLNGSAGASIDYSDVAGGCDPAEMNCDENVYDVDPQFVNAALFDLRVQPTSSVIDAGNNYMVPDGVTTDILGNPRFFDLLSKYDTGWETAPIVDMGAYEYWVDCPTGPIVYVDQDASGADSGDSWTDAYTDLAAALEVGPMCSATNEYWVAEGIYLPGNYDASDTFHMDGGMQVYGGFDGTETARDERDVWANVTILSGDIDGDDDGNNADGNFIAEDAGEIVGENPYHVVTIDGGEMVANPTNTVLDGFTITGGYATGVTSNAFGGGLYCFGASDAMCSPTLQNLVFSGNYATEGGGGLANDGQGGSSSPLINNVTFVGNWAGTLQDLAIGAGGAILNRGQGSYEGIGTSNPTITNSTFIGNKAKFHGGAIYNDGTADGESSPVVANSTFVGNESAHYGGAVFNAAWDYGLSTPSYTNVTFSGNSATYGGGNMAGSGYEGTLNATVVNSILWGGSAATGPESNTQSGTTTFSYSVIANAYDESGQWDTVLGTDGGNNTEADPKLSALADNGGATQTLALLAGSSAVNAGDDTACAGDPVNGLDQRDIIRPQGPHCDIGSFERVNAAPPADFDGLGHTDISVFRNGVWFLRGQGVTGWGQTGDVPVPADYDGDGDSDIAIYRPSTSGWRIKDQFSVGYGGMPGDVPIPRDFDGDGDADIAIFRAATAGWYIKDQYVVGYGLPGDIPVPGDYDGDGTMDIAVFRDGVWYIRGQGAFGWGMAGDIPVPGDYDGNGSTDLAVYRPSTGGWRVKNQFVVAYGGLAGDIPVPGDYNVDGRTELGIYRPSNATWFVKDTLVVGFGLPTDFPLPAPDTNGDADPYQ